MSDLHSVVSQEQVEAERALIGAVVRSPQMALQEAGWLTEDNFMVPEHKIFWNRVLNGEDPVTVTFAIPEMTKAFTWSNEILANRVGDYAQALHDKDQMRMALIAAEEIVKASRQGDKDAVQAIAYSLANSQGGSGTGMRSPVEIGESLNRRIDARNLSIPWGIESLDVSTRGSEVGTLTVLAARPSMGKSSLAFQVNEYQALTLEKKVGVWALEMSAEQMFARRNCHKVQAMWMDVRSENITEQQREDLKKYVAEYSATLEAHMQVNDNTGTTVADIVRTQLREKFDVIMVDHLGLLKDKQLKSERHDQYIGRQTEMLHALAKNTQCVVLLLAQLNRGVENRTDKRPHMGDLRDSGHIEQNADNVGLMYGEWYYDRNAENYTEINWGKYRDGVKDTLCLVQFNMAEQKFESVETEDFDAYLDSAMEDAHNGQATLFPEQNDDDGVPF